MERRLAAVLAADVVGYTRLIRDNEDATLAALKALRADVIAPIVDAHQGRIVKLMGDGTLIEFSSALAAVQAATEIQVRVAAGNASVAADARVVMRMGINLGDIVLDDDDIYGDGVNVAARLEAMAQPGGLNISGKVFEEVRDRSDLVFEDLGEQEVKNINRPVRIWRWVTDTVETLGASPMPVSDKPSVVVLPFENMSGDKSQDFFADGIVEAITAALSRIGSFFVIARNTANCYRGRVANVIDIGHELGVTYVLEGSVQQAGGRLRITVQLVETEAGMHVWAERYDGAVDELFDLQDRITEHVVGALQPSIRLAEIERSRRKRPQDLGAYDYTMQAMACAWSLERTEVSRALELLHKALDIDPDYPLALSLAGWCFAQRSVYNWADDLEDSREHALQMAERAAQLNGDDPLILAVLGAVHTFLRNRGAARVLLERALALDPNSAWALSRLGWVENYSDNPEKAREYFERAIRLSPLDPINFNNYVGIGSSFDVAGEYEAAAANYQRALEERPHADWIYRSLAPALAGAGRMDEARAAYDRMMAYYPDLTVTKFKQAMVFSPDALEQMSVNLRKLGLPE